MARRSIEDTLLERAWFRRLPLEHKLAWLLIYFRGAHPAGVWEIQADWIHFYLGTHKWSVSEFVKSCNTRPGELDGLGDEEEHVIILKGGRHLWLVDYVTIAHPGGLHPGDPAVRQVVNTLTRWGLIDRVRQQYTLTVAKPELEMDAPIAPPTEREAEKLFEEFWKLYPRKDGKLAAKKAWKKLGAAVVLLWPKMELALKAKLADTEWAKDGGKFIPHPATWLNGQRWADEGTKAVSATNNPPGDDHGKHKGARW